MGGVLSLRVLGADQKKSGLGPNINVTVFTSLCKPGFIVCFTQFLLFSLENAECIAKCIPSVYNLVSSG